MPVWRELVVSKRLKHAMLLKSGRKDSIPHLP
jgi:hypothetical protein